MYNILQKQFRIKTVIKKDEVSATTSFDKVNDDYWDEEDYYGDDDKIDADTDDYGVENEENLPDFFGEDEEEDDYDDYTDD